MSAETANEPRAERPTALWKRLTESRRQDAARAFWSDQGLPVEQKVEAQAVIAQRLKFRYKSVTALSLDRKTRYLAATPNLPELLVARLLVAYHLAHQRPMMAAFLEALGIKHEDGLIADESVAKPAPDRLAAAAKTLAASFPPADVSIYFSTLLAQDPETWEGLGTLPETEPQT